MLKMIGISDKEKADHHTKPIIYKKIISVVTLLFGVSTANARYVHDLLETDK
jgi:hypothetical protein